MRYTSSFIIFLVYLFYYHWNLLSLTVFIIRSVIWCMCGCVLVVEFLFFPTCWCLVSLLILSFSFSFMLLFAFFVVCPWKVFESLSSFWLDLTLVHHTKYLFVNQDGGYSLFVKACPQISTVLYLKCLLWVDGQHCFMQYWFEFLLF